MRKTLFIIISIALVCVASFFVWTYICAEQPSDSSLKTVTFPDNKIIHVKLADTRETQTRGLSGAPDLNSFDGMLFIFPEEHTARFWMKEMNFPLDIIYLNNQKQIVEIHRELPPCADIAACPKISAAGANVRFVLEIAAGKAAESNLQIGQTLLW